MEALERLGFKHIRRNVWRTSTHEARVYAETVQFGKRPYWRTVIKRTWLLHSWQLNLVRKGRRWIKKRW